MKLTKDHDNLLLFLSIVMIYKMCCQLIICMLYNFSVCESVAVGGCVPSSPVNVAELIRQFSVQEGFIDGGALPY